MLFCPVSSQFCHRSFNTDTCRSCITSPKSFSLYHWWSNRTEEHPHQVFLLWTPPPLKRIVWNRRAENNGSIEEQNDTSDYYNNGQVSKYLSLCNTYANIGYRPLLYQLLTMQLIFGNGFFYTYWGFYLQSWDERWRKVKRKWLRLTSSIGMATWGEELNRKYVKHLHLWAHVH